MQRINNEMLAQIDVSDDELSRELRTAFGETADAPALEKAIGNMVADFKADTVIKGKVVAISGQDVVVSYASRNDTAVGRFPTCRATTSACSAR